MSLSQSIFGKCDYVFYTKYVWVAVSECSMIHTVWMNVALAKALGLEYVYVGELCESGVAKWISPGPFCNYGAW